ncbi:unnamed protein product [Microthlaspi erraticum]|uniref:K Homology domain-containing protein n=1 Tax=Microthlaspi erraticum TaxID=1685480 RepID=A0A6D2IJ73_9BRAS|nr:unnamed protein product [Microthlaspi erraticum]
MEGNRFGSPERSKMQTSQSQPRRTLSVPEGHAKFRILCFVNQVGDVIGKRGSVIKEIMKSTESKIRVEEGRIGSPEQVITIIAHADSTSWVKLVANNAGKWKKEEQEVEDVEVSNAQAALIRVFEVLKDRFWSGEASCRLLIEDSYAGVMKGHAGKMLKRNCQEIGCKAKIVADNLPICADPDDVMMEIKGNVMAVKKALVSVSSDLQSWQKSCVETIDRDLSRPMETNSHDYRLRKDDVLSHRTSLGSSNRKTEAVPHPTFDVFRGDVREVDPRGSLHRQFEMGQEDRSFESFPRNAYERRTCALETASASKNHPRSEYEDDYRMLLPPGIYQDDLVLKILCPRESVGGINGEGCADIQTLRGRTDASIQVGDTVADCDECLITFQSKIPEERRSPAQIALDVVFARLFEISTGTSVFSGSRSSTTARLVVSTKQIGFLLREGAFASTCPCVVLILDVAQNPKCISAKDQVVQISGELSDVQRAIKHVTGMLRYQIVRNSRLTDQRPEDPSLSRFSHVPMEADDILRYFEARSHNSTPAYADSYTRPEDPFPSSFSDTRGYSGWPSTMNAHDSSTHGAPRGAYDGSGGLSSRMADPGLGSGLVVEIRVPETAVRHLCREEEDSGSDCLRCMRQDSGARVIVREPHLGIIAISGTRDQIQKALITLAEFIRVYC